MPKAPITQRAVSGIRPIAAKTGLGFGPEAGVAGFDFSDVAGVSSAGPLVIGLFGHRQQRL